ncbi:CMD domain protein [Leucobacter sp. wl10]|uniref:CMD domain protein n=1 Tax=Leucobacter sp. wl10 TaxID=2304677 RepID=UPI001F09F836|nr:CMD domain protein [Leucobacter sp. wl10]
MTTGATAQTDIIDALTGIAPGDPLDAARGRRPDAHAQGSFEALFRPVDASQVSLPERAAIALFVARLHEQPAAVAFYGALLRETGGGAGLEPLIVAEAERAAGSGPYGAFRAENAPESTDGAVYAVASVEAAYALGDRRADGASVEAGELGTLAAEVARAAREGLGGADPAPAVEPAEQLPPAPRVAEPPRFTQDSLCWKPWLEPLPVAEFTERHYEALVERERTLTDLDIFHNANAAARRARTRRASTAACSALRCTRASARGGTRSSMRPSHSWPRPPASARRRSRRCAGFDELELLDAIQAGAFFNWANRLMLSLGEPTV